METISKKLPVFVACKMGGLRGSEGVKKKRGDRSGATFKSFSARWRTKSAKRGKEGSEKGKASAGGGRP